MTRLVHAVCLAMLAAPAFAQETPIAEAAPAASAAPEARPDPEDRAPEVAPDAPGEAPEPETAEAQDGAPHWQSLRETPDAYSTCLAALRDYGTVFEEREPMTGQNPDCGIANPVEVTEILPGVALRPEAVMRCETARALASWVEGTVVPAAERVGILSPIAAINHGSTYVCRNRGGVASGKVSEHAYGNAVDVMGFRFEDDSSLAIEPRADAGTIEEAFQRASRGGACLDFTTVLGPGTNAAHANHLHLDIKQRNGGYRICQ
ncbi:extensin family protein [Palleronia sp.]|uniref:extensin-like domain-containing protein n=1 Tax=Palleronia sp. TaxID=1940284 RepID=UPI0035C841A1